MIEGLDYILVAAAIFGGLLMLLWVYNSTSKERRQMMRANRSLKKSDMNRLLESGEYWQKIIFVSAFIVTGIIITVFAIIYYVQYGTGIDMLYYIAAIAFLLFGIGTIIFMIVTRRRND